MKAMENVMTTEARTGSSTTYKFEYGLPGFEHLSEFEFKNLDEFPPFKLFQSVEVPDISMIVLDGSLLNVYEHVTFPKHEMNILEMKNREYLRIFVILRLDDETKRFVANTKAPIILNTYTGFGKQIILDNPKLSEDYKLDNL